ncbi:MAG: cell division protein FtsK [Patescibacteria group bacterium]|nr:cell division protein FtsK [Patescibacteria group bacterium]
MNMSDPREMTAQTIGRDLLQALVQELRLLPKPWPELAEAKQNDIIDYEVTGKAVLVVVANAGDYTAGMDEVQGEADQRAIDLGHEYRDDDGGGMEGNTVDGEVLGLPKPDDMKPSEEELQAAYEEGYQAASEGKPESDCPIIISELVVEWIRGWKAWHEEHGAAA